MNSTDFNSIVNPNLRMVRLDPSRDKLFKKYADGGSVDDGPQHDFMEDITAPLIEAGKGFGKGIKTSISNLVQDPTQIFTDAAQGKPIHNPFYMPSEEDFENSIVGQAKRAVSSPRHFGEVLGEQGAIPALIGAGRGIGAATSAGEYAVRPTTNRWGTPGFAVFKGEEPISHVFHTPESAHAELAAVQHEIGPVQQPSLLDKAWEVANTPLWGPSHDAPTGGNPNSQKFLPNPFSGENEFIAPSDAVFNVDSIDKATNTDPARVGLSGLLNRLISGGPTPLNRQTGALLPKGMGHTVDRAIEQAKVGKMPGTQWANYLKPGRQVMFGNVPAGITADELRFSGTPFQQALQSPESLTREQLLDAVKEGRAKAKVSVNEKMGDDAGPYAIGPMSGVARTGMPVYGYTSVSPGLKNYAELMTSFPNLPKPRSHFGNAVSWSRVGTTPMPGGGFSHRIDEVQSDIHHQGADRGYYDPSDPDLMQKRAVGISDMIGEAGIEPNSSAARTLTDLMQRYHGQLVPEAGTREQIIATLLRQAGDEGDIDLTKVGNFTSMDPIAYQQERHDIRGNQPVRRYPMGPDAWIDHEMRKNLLVASLRGADSMSLVPPEIMRNRYRADSNLGDMYANIIQPKFLSLAKKYGLDVNELPQPTKEVKKDPENGGTPDSFYLDPDYIHHDTAVSRIRELRKGLAEAASQTPTRAQFLFHFRPGEADVMGTSPGLNNIRIANAKQYLMNRLTEHFGVDPDLLHPEYSAIKEAHDRAMDSYRNQVVPNRDYNAFRTINDQLYNEVAPHYAALAERLQGIEDARKQQRNAAREAWQRRSIAAREHAYNNATRIGQSDRKSVHLITPTQPHIMLPPDARDMIIKSGVPVYAEGGAVKDGAEQSL